MTMPHGSTGHAAKPWEHAKHGEGSASDPLAARFVESLSYDTRLYDADIRGSLAHARMLAHVGLISATDLAAIERGLAEVRSEIESAPAGPTAVGVPGAWPGWKIELEDVHMCVEAALTAKVGDPGRRLHTGRSRNDQVALDLRLWLREACGKAAAALDTLGAAFAGLASRQGDVPLPTYTHLQRAQPACVGAECMAWHAMFARDASLMRAMVGWEDGLNASPLGSGAVAGSTLGLDRAMTAEALGFAAPSLSSIDATASRDEALDFVYALTRTAIHLSRLAEQWIIYCTTEFGFVTLGEAYTTGSSMMPQKRNPDMLELIRGRSGVVIGHLTALAGVLKGLPLAYNRDLQEDKRVVFAAYDTVMDCVDMAARIVATVRFNTDRIGGSLDRGHLDATVLAEYFVSRGVPFRTAHQIVGALVRLCDQRGVASLSGLELADFRGAVDASGCGQAGVDADVFDHLGAATLLGRYRSLGHAGTGPGGYRDWLASMNAAGSSKPARTLATDDDGAIAESPAAGLFGDVEPDASGRSSAQDAETLAGLYARGGRTLDDLPYTPEFAAMLEEARRVHPGLTARDLFHRLHNLRKAGKLPKVGRAAGLPVRLDPGEEAWLTEQIVGAVGSLGQRDQLPLTPAFDALVERFNARWGRSLEPHAVWRCVAKLAK
jgi:argininosuccinate lyase